MSDDINKKVDESTAVKQPQPKPQSQQNAIVQLAQAINTLSTRITNLEISNIKIKADIEIAEKDRDILYKRIDFADMKIENLEE